MSPFSETGRGSRRKNPIGFLALPGFLTLFGLVFPISSFSMPAKMI